MVLDFIELLFQIFKRSKFLNHLKMCYLLNQHNTVNYSYLNTNSNRLACVNAALAAGLYPNIVRLDKANFRLINE